MISNRLDNKKGVNFMKAFDEIWEKIHSTQEWGQYPSEHVIRFVARNFYNKDRKHTKLLDFGCGGGAHTWYMAREGFEVYALDGSPSAIEKTKKRLEHDELTANLLVMDGTQMDYPLNYFDGIIDNVTICANMNCAIQEMYDRCYKALKKNGKFFTSCFTKETDGFGTGIKIEENTYRDLTRGCLSGRAIVHFFTEKELFGILSEVGYKNIQIDTLSYTDNTIKVDMILAQAEK